MPFLMVLAPSERYHEQRKKRHKTITDWARQTIYQLHRWLPGQALVVVGDGSYAVLQFLAAVTRLPQITVITPLRLDAALYDPAPKRTAHTKGRPALKGKRQLSRALRLSVLAFETLPADIQAKLFIDINAKQKSVKHSLLAELYADLHKDASDPAVRIRSIISRSIQFLDADPQSPFHHRVQNAEEKRDDIRCISLNSIFRALDSDLYIKPSKKGSNIVYGPFWSDKGNDAILQRTLFIINKWFSKIRDTAPEWWDAGSGEGGGLAMNDSIVANINVLRSIFHHLEARDHILVMLNDEDIFKLVEPYESAICQYLSSLNEAERRNYRLLRGNQGQTTRMKYLQQAIHEAIPDFSPLGLANFLAEQKAQTNSNAKEIVDRIEKTLQSIVLNELKREFGPDESQWWMEGLQKPIRMKVSQSELEGMQVQ